MFPAWFRPALLALAIAPVVAAALTATTRSWPASLVEEWFGTTWARSWRLRFVSAYVVIGGTLVAVLVVAALAATAARRLRPPSTPDRSE